VDCRHAHGARRVALSPAYPQISQAIDKNVNAAMSGKTSPEDALSQAQIEIEQALQTVLDAKQL
jgi:ABC-type glycerol-3-phosphate transport system substrate-binding protein